MVFLKIFPPLYCSLSYFHWPICHQHAVFVFLRLAFSPLSSASFGLFCSLPPFLLVRGSIINNAWLCNTLTEQISQQVAVMIVVRGPAGIIQHCIWFCLIMKVPASALLRATAVSQRLPCSHEIRPLYNACSANAHSRRQGSLLSDYS